LPQKVICEKCSFVLYEGTELKPPDEIIQTHDGKCPNCGKKISFIPKKVEVKSADILRKRR
jgi:DNA-directed RNA polymerase subunit RPC12/RpoP